MIHLPTAMFQKFQQIPQKLSPIFQSQGRPLLRPEEIPTDGADVFDQDEDAIERRKAARQKSKASSVEQTAPVSGSLAAPASSLASATSSIAGNPFQVAGAPDVGAPETRALLSNIFKTAMSQVSDTTREEAPRVALDLSGKEYNQHENNRQNRQPQ